MLGYCNRCNQSMAGCKCLYDQSVGGNTQFQQTGLIPYIDGRPYYIQTIMTQLNRIESSLNKEEMEDYYSIRKDKYDFMVETLKKIANEDYRGNKSQASVKAFETLKYIGEIQDE